MQLKIALDDYIPESGNYFKWKEALWLPSWQLHCFPTEQQQESIISFASKLVKVREFLGYPMIVHTWLRPISYNEFVSGADDSYHMAGRAIDFHVQFFEGKDECQRVRRYCMPHLKKWGLRMENRSGGWVHLDDGLVVYKRYFTP